jgi:23S rRNA (uracil1939-C5)-methyltransferase
MITSTTTPRVIRALGAEGDGIIDGAGGTGFIPFALPGEQVIGSPEGWQRTGPDSIERRVPVCRHYQTCGGCVAQHMSVELQHRWKQETVSHALTTHGLRIDVSPIRAVPPASRRRASLTAERRGKVVQLGYLARRSHVLIDIDECPVLVPELVALLPAARVIAGLALHGHEPIKLDIAALDGGLDINIEAKDLTVDTPLRLKFASASAQYKIGRLSLNGNVLIERSIVSLPTRGGSITPPPGAFFQAADAAQQIMTDLTLEAVTRKVKRVTDLFCGVGTFTLPLAAHAKVLAVDGDKAALSALSATARMSSGLKPIETLRRDLMTEPLSSKELDGTDLVVFDPPRAGAKAQADMIAGSKVTTVVAISCNPTTLARDLKILVDGGYTLTSVTPIDQFAFTSHVEVVAVLKRLNPVRR